MAKNNKKRKTSSLSGKKTKLSATDKFCLHIRTQSIEYRFIYERMRSKYKKMSDRVNVASGVIGAIIATMGFISFGNNATSYISIILACFGFLVSVLSVLSTVWKINDNLANSINAHTNFCNIITDIDFHFALKIKDRADSEKFLADLKSRFDTTLAAAPIPDEGIKKILAVKFPHSTILLDDNSQFINDNFERESSEESSQPIVIPILTIGSTPILNSAPLRESNELRTNSDITLEEILVTSL